MWKRTGSASGDGRQRPMLNISGICRKPHNPLSRSPNYSGPVSVQVSLFGAGMNNGGDDADWDWVRSRRSIFEISHLRHWTFFLRLGTARISFTCACKVSFSGRREDHGDVTTALDLLNLPHGTARNLAMRNLLRAVILSQLALAGALCDVCVRASEYVHVFACVRAHARV